MVRVRLPPGELRRHAHKMAQTGLYPTCYIIELELRGEGYTGVKEALASDREAIDRECAEAQKGAAVEK